MNNICCEISQVIRNLESLATQVGNSLITNGQEAMQSPNGTSCSYRVGSTVSIAMIIIIAAVMFLLLQRPKNRNNPSQLTPE